MKILGVVEEETVCYPPREEHASLGRPPRSSEQWRPHKLPLPGFPRPQCGRTLAQRRETICVRKSAYTPMVFLLRKEVHSVVVAAS